MSLVRYIYERLEALGMQPEILHYASHRVHPKLSVTLKTAYRLWPRVKQYEFRGMRSRAIGAWFPEWEPNRLASNFHWKRALKEFDGAILVTGSAHTGAPLLASKHKFVAWVSSTVEDDRKDRLMSGNDLSARAEKAGLSTVMKLEQKVLKKAIRILAVSEDTKTRLQALIADLPVEIYPYPIDTTYWRSGRRRYQTHVPHFVFVGRAMDPRKNLRLFFESDALLRSTRPGLGQMMTIVSSVEPRFSEMPPTLRDDGKLRVMTNLSLDDLREVYRSANALLLTSHQEGLGIAAMEAMACGTPVISTRCGGPETFIQDGINGFLLPADASEFAFAMFKVAIDDDILEWMGKQAESRIRKDFSREVWDERFDEVLRSL